MKAVLALFFVFLYNCGSLAWIIRNPTNLGQRTLMHSSSGGVANLSLENLENHEEEGDKMAKSITAWLDAEWIPQEVHIRMAESAKTSYISCREAGESDLMSIMTVIADDLSENWHEYNDDAFINAWDISNYVSDYLVKLSGNEGCDCSNKIY